MATRGGHGRAAIRRPLQHRIGGGTCGTYAGGARRADALREQRAKSAIRRRHRHRQASSGRIAVKPAGLLAILLLGLAPSELPPVPPPPDQGWPAPSVAEPF